MPNYVAMGPRLCSRGEAGGCWRSRTTQPSQWGHGFVAVESGPPSGAHAGHLTSQWGHGFVAVESSGSASMGTSAISSQWGHGFVAVESTFSQLAPVLRELSQWGHGFVAVERFNLSSEAQEDNIVAMGPRLCSRGERISRTRKSRTKSLRRNGATAL